MSRKLMFVISVAVFLVAAGSVNGAIVNRYSFTDGDSVAVDSVSGKDGLLTGSAVISGNQLVLDSNGTVELPGDVLDPGLESVTIEAWFEINAVQDWQRIFAFGETVDGGGGNLIFYTPTSGSGDSRFVIATNGTPSWQTGEEMVTGPAVEPGTQTHIACVYDAAVPEIRLYQDGALVSSAPTTMSLVNVARVFAYIGDALYTSDPHLDGNVDEFRIYNTALTDAEVQESFLAGPDAEVKLANIILVSFHEADDVPQTDAAAAGFTEAPDKGYSDLLTAAGYAVTRYVTTSSPDPDVLNAADLVMISRSINSGDYSNDGATAWNGITSPMVVMSGYTLRTSRMGYTTGTTMVDTAGDITLAVTDPNHPIFDGITLTDGTMDNPFAGVVTYPTDGVTVARGISINNDPVNDDGTVLATVATADDPAVGGMVIGEWSAGAAMSHSGGAETDILAGNRLVFLTGSREADGVDSRTAGMIDLYADGEQMLLNAVKYILTKPLPEGPELVDPGTDGLVAYYPLDSAGRGVTADASGNGLDGTLVGDPGFVSGIVGQAIDLDGDGDYVDCGSNPMFGMQETNQITVATWVTIRSVAHQWGAMVAKGEDAWRLGNASNDPIFHMGIKGAGSDTTYFDGLTTVGYDEWHHVAGIFDGSTMMIYLDGVLDNSITTTETIGLGTPTVLIGENPDATGRYWDGLLDEVYIYNRALSDLEVMYLMNL